MIVEIVNLQRLEDKTAHMCAERVGSDPDIVGEMGKVLYWGAGFMVIQPFDSGQTTFGYKVHAWWKEPQHGREFVSLEYLGMGRNLEKK